MNCSPQLKDAIDRMDRELDYVTDDFELGRMGECVDTPNAELHKKFGLGGLSYISQGDKDEM